MEVTSALEESSVSSASSSCQVSSKIQRKRRGGEEDFEEKIEEVPKMAAVIDRRIPITLEEHVDMVVNVKKTEFVCQDPTCKKVFQNLDEYNSHYGMRHMYKCAECRKSLPGSHFLELHVLETHDTLFGLMAERKPMFSCLAQECPEKFKTPDERYEHFHVFHKKHPLFQTFKHFENISEKGVKGHGSKKNKNKGKKSPEVDMEVDGKAATEDVQTEPKKSSPKSKPTIQFGHSASKFKSWHSKGTKVNLSSDKIMDMSEIETVLEDAKPSESLDLSDVQQALQDEASK